ncbi:1,4-alpha-glucan branching protein GlgB [Frankia sp. Ag45/Mut15]|uniref:1,4-alpha-glucan branching enzyme GlgB n=1 Tax=Frankia umida TaxID=573489 RepID=A0ABT0JWF9_9ACTN|nr:1,4-alpha-glucan branching protein GlgB [Frankia umida]MCK9875882.1 1,4-alpha-glucan branching protein GlgB [Frankia umida]
MAVAEPPPLDVPPGVLDRLVAGTHHDPHSVLGAHPSGDATVVRVLRPDASCATLLVGEARYPATRLHSGGVFAAVLPGHLPDYQVEVTYPHATGVIDDPYRHLPTVGEIDRHLIAEGRHEQLWKVLGAHPRTLHTPGGQAVTGVSFAVWAPSARGVRLVGDFDFWDGRAFPMRSLGSCGVWELFVPGAGAGLRYKYEILGFDGVWRQKADPMAFRTEVPPATASVVTHSTHTWSDGDWIARRASTAWHTEPISIYEVHLGSWRRGLSYLELAEQLTAYVQDSGFTHVELLPVAEHPFGGSWGYQVSAYYAPTARFGSPDEFRHLVETLHQAGIGVIVDWVPAHFPRDSWALGRFDGTPLYEHPDPRRGEQPDWGTYVFDVSRPEVRNFLVANAVYWFEEFHVDALRVDAVAAMLYLDYSRPDGQWLPNEHGGRENLDAVAFLQETNATVYRRFPGAMMIAEESTAWPGVTRPTHLGGLGFGFKWNMGWMHDTLDYTSHQPVHRSFHHHQMTFSMVYAYSENYILPFSHDEVVHGKGSMLRRMPGNRWEQLANLRALYAYMWAHPGKKLLFMGSEFGQDNEWNEGASLDWPLLDEPGHHGLAALVRDLNALYRASPELYRRDVDPTGFSWIDANDTGNNVFSFLRWSGASDTAASDTGSGDATSGGSGVIACITNFAGIAHHEHRIGLPFPGRWREVLNTDSQRYGGANLGNLGAVEATDRPYHGLPASASVTLPVLGAIWLRHDPTV